MNIFLSLDFNNHFLKFSNQTFNFTRSLVLISLIHLVPNNFTTLQGSPMKEYR